MATGAEMALGAMFKMAGINSDEAKRDVARAIQVVLTCDERMARIEANQRLIMTALNIGVSDNDGTDDADGNHSVQRIAAGQ